ncbi:hypothetical protein WISP_99834 [Willisornis vidua]|uniref:Uncharacterized protein n=1 Tax=Willisornis vidua TaxID=1566151 RepID=A0ABQ9CZ57_9PASS|nr:hypothetical protein WISP_99834 [Willisornis vidua]
MDNASDYGSEDCSPDFIGNCSQRARSSGYELKEGKFRVYVGKKFFAVRLVRHWNRLPQEAADAPTLVMFKAMLDKALSNLA